MRLPSGLGHDGVGAQREEDEGEDENCRAGFHLPSLTLLRSVANHHVQKAFIVQQLRSISGFAG